MSMLVVFDGKNRNSSEKNTVEMILYITRCQFNNLSKIMLMIGLMFPLA